MTLLQAALLGIVEGVTEFLPVSSTAHLMFASALLSIAQTDFVKSFEIIIQLGAIAAVAVLYWRDFLNWDILKKIIVAFIPTGIIGLALYSFIKNHLEGNITIALWALFLGGFVLIAFEWWYGGRAQQKFPPVPLGNSQRSPSGTSATLSYMQSFVIGLAQAVAIIPGVSRSGATIVGGLVMGIDRPTIVQFSFLLAVPTMLAATGLDFVKNFHTIASGGNYIALTVGFVVSFIVALVVVKWFLAYVRRHNFVPFGIYRVLAAILFFFLIFR